MLYFTLISRQSDALALAADTETNPNDSALERSKVTAKNILRKLADPRVAEYYQNNNTIANCGNNSTVSGGSSSNNQRWVGSGNSFNSNSGSYYNNSSSANGNAVNGNQTALAPSGATSLLTVEASNYYFHVLTTGGVMFLTMCDAPSGPSGSGLGTSAATTHAFAYLEDVSREFLIQYRDQIWTVSRPYPFIRFDSFLQKTKKVFLQGGIGGNKGSLCVGNNSSLTQRNPIVKKSYKEIMGLGNQGGVGGRSGGNFTTRGGIEGDSSKRSFLDKISSDGSLAIVLFFLLFGIIVLVLLFFYLFFR